MEYNFELIDETTPSGKQLFQCQGCGTKDPAPTKYHDCVKVLRCRIKELEQQLEDAKRRVKAVVRSWRIANGVLEQEVSRLREALEKIQDTYAKECPLKPSCIEIGPEQPRCFTCTVAEIAEQALGEKDEKSR